jgi:hypothetical protein
VGGAALGAVNGAGKTGAGATAGAKPTRTAGSASISSIKEVKGDSKALDELQGQVSFLTFLVNPSVRSSRSLFLSVFF